jgi:hypothetical protein
VQRIWKAEPPDEWLVTRPAYERGRRANIDGEPFSANPFPEGNCEDLKKSRYEWFMGWLGEKYGLHRFN